MTCTACGTVNPAGRKFCGECGGRLAVACASCGALLDAGQKFCGECGTPVTAPAGAVTAAVRPIAAQNESGPAPVSERKLVSVLFADLVGFTPFAEERDSEDVRETLTKYFDIAKDVIGRHGGTVEKFIGDAVMAVWGTPTAREDDAERAVRTALELLDAIHDLGPGISARAGVLTGEAAVTLGAADQGMVAGDLVNTAARLQSVAPPGVVLVGEVTYRAASAAIAFEPAGEQLLKGKQAPVPAWRALRVVAERGGRGRTEGLEAPFTGRDAELRLLKELFHTTGRESRARLVSMTGPGGIGKSRLSRELEKYLDGVVETVWWHHGRSPAYSGGITFWALGEMVRARCGLAETDDEANTRAKVAKTLAEHLPDADERAWVEPAILQLLGVDVTPVSASELFARWRVLFERLAATGTVVLVFEDLHWADPGTLDFIDHVLEWSKSTPILILTLSRPELLESRPDWGAGRRNFVAVALDPLSDADMRSVLVALVPGLPEAAARRIVERAEGIPLYAVETVRMLVAEGRLKEQDGVYAVVDEIEALAVPETLTALIAARLDTLEPADRALALDAAVLGQRFTVDGLAAVSGVEPAALESRLRGLVRRELLTLEADPRSPERGQYGFVQALIREVAYNTLARRDRKDRHLAAARYFEQLGNDELAGALAGHYLSAHANAQEGPEADTLAAQARVALRGAADRAASLASYDQSATLLRQALTVAHQDPERADLMERLGLALLPAGHVRDAIEMLTEALDLQIPIGDDVASARATAALADALLMAQRPADALPLLADAIDRYGEIEDPGLVLRLKALRARTHLVANELRAAVAAADEVLEPAERARDVAILADALVTKGTALVNLGRQLEGIAVLELGDHIAEEQGINQARFRSHYNRLNLLRIDPRRGHQVCVQGVALARKVGNVVWANMLSSNLAWAAFLVGDWETAERETAYLLDSELSPTDESDALLTRCIVLTAQGRPVADEIAHFERLRKDSPSQFTEGNFEGALAYVALADGRYREAADRFRGITDAIGEAFIPYEVLGTAWMAATAGDAPMAAERLAAFDAIDLPKGAYEVIRDGAAGAIAIIEGRPTEGMAAMAAAQRRLDEIGLPYDAARVAIAAGRLAPDDPRTAGMLAEARAFYARVGASAMLRQVDELLGATADPEATADLVTEP